VFWASTATWAGGHDAAHGIPQQIRPWESPYIGMRLRVVAVSANPALVVEVGRSGRQCRCAGETVDPGRNEASLHGQLGQRQ
jgi:hypothetical protein